MNQLTKREPEPMNPELKDELQAELQKFLHEPKIGWSEVVAVTGVSPRNLANWVHRGLFDMTRRKLRANRRYYSGLDAVTVAVMVSLTEIGILVGPAAFYAGLVREKVEQDGYPFEGNDELYLSILADKTRAEPVFWPAAMERSTALCPRLTIPIHSIVMRTAHALAELIDLEQLEELTKDEYSGTA